MFAKTFLFLIAWASVASTVSGQAGVSSSSVGISRAGLSRTTSDGRFRMPTPEYFRVEEFINYHRHDLELPAEGQRVSLDMKQVTVADGKTVLQIGIATPRAIDPEVMPPLNIVLVIDQSGSMSGDRILNVKKSIRAFIERIRPFDKISIVGFSNSARLMLDACKKSEYQTISKAIDGIRAGGSTNLHGGLMLGYKTALQHFDTERTNRVILLTDGIANVGTTDPEQIARDSKEFNQKGIHYQPLVSETILTISYSEPSPMLARE